MSSVKLRENIELLHQYGIYEPSKTIIQFGEINSDSADAFIANLHLADLIPGTVSIKFSTGGGCVTSGLMMYDAIRAMKNYVRIICYGEVASMGTVILQAADERVMMPHSYLMTHYGVDSNPEDHPFNNKALRRINDYLEKKCQKIYMDKIKEVKPRYTYSKMEKELLLFDTYLTPDKVIGYGLADRVEEGSY